MTEHFDKQRKLVVDNLEKMCYIQTKEIKKAMMKVRREEFVDPEYKNDAYIDTPLPIPGGVTISAPHMHAIFLSALKLKKGDKFLEVGAGSGVVLAYAKEVVCEEGKVIGIEFVPEAFEFARNNLKRTGYLKKVKLILGDGSKGLPDEAPFDKILISASCPEIPRPLIEQLKPGGILLAPVGAVDQELIYLEKTKDGEIITKNLGGVIFLRLRGQFGFKE